jgi:hypothetical protein
MLGESQRCRTNTVRQLHPPRDGSPGMDCSCSPRLANYGLEPRELWAGQKKSVAVSIPAAWKSRPCPTAQTRYCDRRHSRALARSPSDLRCANGGTEQPAKTAREPSIYRGRW